jgi:hypothetical protein
MAASMILRQYSHFRTSPDDFPSYERLKFVRLPPEYLPSSWSLGCPPLRHWPALVYQNYAEVVRDLPSHTPKVIKGRLLVEHLKHPGVSVARLLGWDDDGRWSTTTTTTTTTGSSHLASDDGGGGASSSSSSSSSSRPFFPERRLKLLRLDDQDDAAMIDFVDEQIMMEKACDELVGRFRRRRRLRDDSDIIVGEEEEEEARRHILRFRDAVDVALNCLAIDVGADPMPPRRRIDDCDVIDEVVVVGMGSGKGERDIPVARGACNDDCGAAKEKRMVDKTVFSVERIGEIATTKTSSAEDVASDDATDERKTKRGGRGKNGRVVGRTEDASRGGDRRAVIDRTDGMTAEKGVDGRREGVAESALPRSASGEPSRQTGGAVSVVVPNAIEIEAVTWKAVWAVMRRSGWSWKGGSGLMTDYYYIKPKCKVQGGAPGRDYFVRVEDVMEFARDVYGWHQASSSSSSLSREEIFSRIEDHARHCGERVPPLLDVDGELSEIAGCAACAPILDLFSNHVPSQDGTHLFTGKPTGF